MQTTTNPLQWSSTYDQPHDVLHNMRTSRKCWKTVKGERVWPPYLEAALVEGLKHYQPDDSRETRMLGRYPLRNRFISDYIFRTTGKIRSPKQVGSRLQQLRTSGGKQLLSKMYSDPAGDDTICAQHRFSDSPSPYLHSLRADRYGSSESSTSSSSMSSGSPISPIDSPLPMMHATLSPPAYSRTHTSHAAGPSRTVVNIDILPENHGCSPGRGKRRVGSPASRHSAPHDYARDDEDTIFRPSPYPRPLRAIDPTISFLSQSTISATSVCTVLLDGVCVHTDATRLELVKSSASHALPGMQPTHLYSVQLAPEYWETLCKSEDPSRYTITQEVTRTQDPGAWPECMINHTVIFSAIYRFTYSEEAASPRSQLGSERDIRNAADTLTETSFGSFLSDPFNSFDSLLLDQGGESDIFCDFLGVPDGDPIMSPDTLDLTDTPASTSTSLAVHPPANGTGYISSEARPLVPVSPSSSCFPTDLSNYIM